MDGVVVYIGGEEGDDDQRGEDERGQEDGPRRIPRLFQFEEHFWKTTIRRREWKRKG